MIPALALYSDAMTPCRRRFLQSLGAGAIVAGAPGWAFARAFDPRREQAPAVRDPKYREWSTSALAEAKRQGLLGALP